MARTIAQIQAQIIAEKTANATLNTLLTSTSLVAVWRLWTYIVAVCIWTLETLFDAHKAEVNGIIATQKPHTLQWYAVKAKQFQYGDTLPADSDVYDPISTDEAVLVVAYAAAIETLNSIRIKVARLNSGTLDALSAPQLSAFTAYMARVKDAGVRLVLTSGEADNLRLKVAIYYDPLVLNNAGERLDGTAATPVKDAINDFLTNLPFNGLFVVNKLIDAIMNTEGVVNGVVNEAKANYAATPYVVIPVEYVPDAGYMVLDGDWFDLYVTYTAHAPI